MRRRMRLLAAAMAALPALAPGAAAASPAQFQALEDRLSAALARYDAKAVGDLWDDQFVFVFPDGHVAHKPDRLARLTPPPGAGGPALASHNDKVAVQYEDANVAVVLVTSTWRQGEVSVGDAYLATHIWIRRGGDWRLLSAQVARITR